MTVQSHLSTFGGSVDVQEYVSDKYGQYFTLTFKEGNHGDISVFCKKEQLEYIASAIERAIDELEMRREGDTNRINVFSSL